ncbi:MULTISPECIES: lasso RiPP family leader peptide-containing protein [Streptomyces]|uniref:Lasso RiPP family leader peptide-containing protein n=1 Tax=Streptomyces prasinus TaxID=67345 RepID=A0ABX6ART1_9ACTN|nr:lasso RiPP family leader peptide-containing protein [Streptomyces prasinus]QEV04697.1 lasso RiPP family leader peptide-containing protein [Streptomyces prasinus]
MTFDSLAAYLRDAVRRERRRTRSGAAPSPSGPPAHESPLLVDLGHVREVTLGSSPSGSADANAQYYW